MNEIWHNLFSMSEPWPEKVIRSVAVYLFLFLALRLAGKRELGNVNTADLIVLLLISNTVQNAIIGDETSLIGGIAGATILFVLNRVISVASYHKRQVRLLVDGEPVELIRDGEVLESAMAKERITLDELAMVVREHGIGRLSDVEHAILEPNGMISAIPNDPGTPIAERLSRIEESLQQLLRRSDPSPVPKS